MNKIYPKKLVAGDTIAVIAPSESFLIISDSNVIIAKDRFTNLNLHVEFAKHIYEINEFNSSCIKSRIDDIHWAFNSPNIKGIFTTIGGYNNNQLIKYLDWDVIRNNPKVFCGYSDVTVLQNAFFAKTGLVTYSGPHYSSFAQKLNFDYTLSYVKQCLFSNDPIVVKSSSHWSDDTWYLNQNDCNLIPNDGAYAIQYGQASGTILGGNLVSFRTLQGTEYFPKLDNVILFLEEDSESQPAHFDRDLQSLLLLNDFYKIKGIVLGRFQKNSNMTIELLKKIITTKKELSNIPIIANVNFGHTSPIITFPIGGEVTINATPSNIDIVITKH